PTFTSCSDAVGSTDESFVISLHGALPIYTPGSTVGATAISTIVIQGRRAGCTSGAGCAGTAYVTLASWNVSPPPVGPTLLAKAPDRKTTRLNSSHIATLYAVSGWKRYTDD